jgi:hypothetical protein
MNTNAYENYWSFYANHITFYGTQNNIIVGANTIVGSVLQGMGSRNKVVSYKVWVQPTM